KNSGAVSGEALRYVGEILFKQAAPNVPAYNKFKLKGGTVDKLLASIQAKTQALEKLKAAFGPVLTSKDAHWGVATLYVLAEATEDLALMLANPPEIK